ncbi:hypothetical protein H696_05272 [Fonticula alba]|uniref:Serine/threonine-protein phosphatase n=1 Tax=Fonticula alba TaxID=691883 RepID=A0A058Z2I8_FONAL|nr:hypothetical protein H696_05272 [Fonticula alba]KCV68356.1 hypothetical protein H696_05272 [Fonticula alba]|eukprot:XP_009497410.1 hypothetical protein H696_05272 [Fonticula alba]
MSPIPIEDITVEKSDFFRLKANDLLKAGRYNDAIPLYSQAIDHHPAPAPATLYTNRSLAYFKAELLGASLTDAETALSLDPGFTKAHYRRGCALMGLCRWSEAAAALATASRALPKDGAMRALAKEAKRRATEAAFLAAIDSAEDQTSIIDTMDWSSIEVESTYTGPRWEDSEETLTPEFVKQVMDFMKDGGVLHRKYLYRVFTESARYLRSLPSLLDVTVSEEAEHITVCGDTHGQYYDLMNIFRMNGLPSHSNPYLFNGDFVDRGSWSVEVAVTMLLWMLALKGPDGQPGSFIPLRGNHESHDQNKVYGFEGEVLHKYNLRVFQSFTELFTLLPLAAVIDSNVFVVHGGLFSRDDVTLDDLRSINRFGSQPTGTSGKYALLSEMLWSDPMDEMGRLPSRRGIAIRFGPDVSAKFLDSNGLKYMIRSHEVKDDGYEVAHDGRCITVFSAPNYCDSTGNKGAFLRIKRGTSDYKAVTFSAVPHPDLKPMAYAKSMGGF